MLVFSIIELTFTTMSPGIISSAARLKACSFNLVIPKIGSLSILIFSAVLAHLDIVVHLAYHQLLPIWMSVTLLSKDGEWNSKTVVLFCFFDPYSVNLVLAQILNEADLYSEKKNILGARVRRRGVWRRKCGQLSVSTFYNKICAWSYV